jgi:hypothetical protein
MSFVLGTPPSFRPGCSESERAANEAADYAPVILEIQAAGITSPAGIAVVLTERGIPNPKGPREGADQICYLLRFGLFWISPLAPVGGFIAEWWATSDQKPASKNRTHEVIRRGLQGKTGDGSALAPLAAAATDDRPTLRTAWCSCSNRSRSIGTRAKGTRSFWSATACLAWSRPSAGRISEYRTAVRRKT